MEKDPGALDTQRHPRLPDFLEFVCELGRGGSGEVVKAWDWRTSEQVAVKLLFPGSDEETRERMRQEARELAALSHPNVVKLVDALEHEGQQILIMELLEGGNLHDFLATVPELALVLEIFAQVCAGLEYIHDQGLVHRDLKPQNILFSAEKVPKIADLGLVRRVGVRSGLTQTGVMMGTCAYVAPEQILSTREAGPASDLYALGVTLFEALTGEWPFDRDNEFEMMQAHLREPAPGPRELRPDLPESLDQLVRRLLEKEPERRPRSAGQVRQALLTALDPEQPAEHSAEREFDPAQALATRDPGTLLLALSPYLRVPMNGVLGNVRLLADSSLTPNQRQHLEALDSSAQEMQRLMQGLIDYTRLQFGRLKLEPVPTDLRGLVQNLVRDQTSLARVRGITLTGHVDMAVPDSVDCDPLRMRQILISLLSNAIQHTDSTNVSVGVHRDSVSADGVSLRMVVSGAAAPGGAAGLGAVSLAVTHALVEKMGGQLWEDQRAVTFAICLPVSGEAPSVVRSARPTRSLNVLVVEDDRINRMVATRLLENQGHRVTSAGDGVEAVELALSLHFDAILMDLDLPRMNGLDATRALRNRGNMTPVVALTGHEREEWTRRCVEAGMDGFLSKPIDEGELLEMLGSVIRTEIQPKLATPTIRVMQAPTGFKEVWEERLEALDQAFRSLEPAPLVQAAEQLQDWLEGLAALPAARAAAQIAALAEEGRFEAALHARRSLLSEIERMQEEMRS
ncbi:response regulator [bacterium CPR1]|nr:response regulator [bacterium CPR1]